MKIGRPGPSDPVRPRPYYGETAVTGEVESPGFSGSEARRRPTRASWNPAYDRTVQSKSGSGAPRAISSAGVKARRTERGPSNRTSRFRVQTRLQATNPQ